VTTYNRFGSHAGINPDSTADVVPGQHFLILRDTSEHVAD
jgi:hypothetical protein